jgi:hypothetical protein
MAGFCNSAGGLHTPNFTDHGPKLGKVSGSSLKYSRFPETAAGDQVRFALRGRRCSANAPKFSCCAAGKLGILSLHCAPTTVLCLGKFRPPPYGNGNLSAGLLHEGDSGDRRDNFGASVLKSFSGLKSGFAVDGSNGST